MLSRLLNVRLDEARVRKAGKLRERGVVLSDLVREAIDRRFEELSAPLSPRDAHAVLAGIFAEYPDAAGTPPRRYDIADRRQARRAILRRLRRTRS